MKKNSTYFISLVACIVFNSVGLAQSPTITTAILPQIGYSYFGKSDTTTADRATFTVSAGSGSAQTWNYTPNFVTTYTSVATFVSPSSGTGNTNFPSANLAVGSGTTWEYFVGNSSGLTVIGAYAGGTTPLTIKLTPYEMFVPTPFTYGNTLNNLYTSTYTLTSGGNTYKSSGHHNRTITADAYGTLTTPTGTFANCLRNKTFETTIDTLYMQVGSNWNFLQRTTDSTTTYQWFQNNNTTFSIMNISLDKKLKVKSAGYFTSFNNDIALYSGIDESATVFPNPSGEVSYVKYENKIAGHVEVSLLDLNGKLIRTLVNTEQNTGTQQIKIDIAAMELAKGLYFVRINNPEGTHTIKFDVN
ncbi:MAG TPA: T9SS type A sorting domain-containing protein [Bacteroidia bacterium]|jgi:hypothetical protein|nr:T9SS type A sorting domain-containing protein [Bacteroidia bacterium]